MQDIYDANEEHLVSVFREVVRTGKPVICTIDDDVNLHMEVIDENREDSQDSGN